ncbi:MAG TPA: protein-glutamate O-methyltransferase CheR [Bacteroidia bacterium]|nr:protein-glutamate O-methyltransferase CheR [Bacteroidia bacterium]
MQENIKHTESKMSSFEAAFAFLRNRFGYDFSGYASTTINRRAENFLLKEQIATPDQLLEKLKDEKMFHVKFAEALTVNFTEMFRDNSFFISLKQKVLPYLATYPSVKIWHAGCSTGEEVYSLAILLYELDLLHKTKIYATDLNNSCLAVASGGLYSFERIRNYTENYRKSGGRNDFSMYYEACNNGVRFRGFLKENITFFQHNLATDNSFNEFHLILCRNVLIYFNRDLQNRAVALFGDSLINLGYLAIGNRENLLFNDQRSNFAFIDKEEKIYRKVIFSAQLL